MNIQATLEAHFKWFHQHPELGNEEKETTARIAGILEDIGVEVLDSGLKTGLVGLIRGTSDGPVVALRADIDALPVTEASGLPYASQKNGCMHACGHDFHLTSLLGAAMILKNDAPKGGTVKLLFQPAEEGGDGAKQVLGTGVLDDVQEIYGMHGAAQMKAGTLAIKAGATHAGVGVFRVLIRGKGTHAAAPHLGLDPILAAARFVDAVQGIVSRETNPFEQAVVSVTHLDAGTTWNVIPPEALIEGTFRSLSVEGLRRIACRLSDICRGIELTCGTPVDFHHHVVTIATNNDAALADFAAALAKKCGYTPVPPTESLGGEDFALYQERIPGLFWFMGVGSPQPLHHPGFAADLSVLQRAAEFHAALARAALTRLDTKLPKR